VRKQEQADAEMLKGTLDMILRTFVTGDAHCHTIVNVIERTSEDVLEVEQGSLCPALHRLEDRGWVSSYWARVRTIEKRSFTGSPLREKSSQSTKRTAGVRWLALSPL
jgi:PadR family transcriptional regulator PadR